MGNNGCIRIAQVIGKMLAGGVEAVVFNYYRELDHNKIQFDFFYDSDSTIKPPQDLIEMGARFYEVPPYQQLWKYFFILRRYLNQENYKIVHSHLNTLSVFPLFLAWTAGIPIRIAHNHSVPGGSEWKRNIVKKILRPLAKIFATDYFACSEKAGRWLFGNNCFDKGKVVVIKNAIDFNKYDIPSEHVDQLKKQLCLADKLVIGHIGRFTFAKNHKKVIDVFNEIHMQREDARLLLVGDGEMRDTIIKRISELGLINYVVCTGKVSDPQNYYPLINVLVLPSHFEGFSMAAIESQISKIPIVISEAIPAEVIICDSCQHISLEKSDFEWAAAVISMIGKQVKLNGISIDFDIKKCAPKLECWYLTRCYTS